MYARMAKTFELNLWELYRLYRTLCRKYNHEALPLTPIDKVELMYSHQNNIYGVSRTKIGIETLVELYLADEESSFDSRIMSILSFFANDIQRFLIRNTSNRKGVNSTLEMRYTIRNANTYTKDNDILSNYSKLLKGISGHKGDPNYWKSEFEDDEGVELKTF